MVQLEHITGRKPGLAERGLRRIPSPIWFLRADAHPTPIETPQEPDLDIDLRNGDELTPPSL